MFCRARAPESPSAELADEVVQLGGVSSLRAAGRHPRGPREVDDEHDALTLGVVVERFVELRVVEDEPVPLAVVLDVAVAPHAAARPFGSVVCVAAVRAVAVDVGVVVLVVGVVVAAAVVVVVGYLALNRFRSQNRASEQAAAAAEDIKLEATLSDAADEMAAAEPSTGQKK